jgi:hypothetical protein
MESGKLLEGNSKRRSNLNHLVQALSFEAVGSSVDVRLATKDSTEIHAGIHVEEGTGMVTNDNRHSTNHNG